MKIKVFTDGSCLGNPGAGGWASIFNFNEEIKKYTGHETNVTNNRMELMAISKTLSQIGVFECDKIKHHDEYIIHCDSAYVVNSIIDGWLDVWAKNGWKTKKQEEVKNKDLWSIIYVRLYKCRKKGIKIKFKKVKGHSGNVFNELADQLANEQAMIAKRSFKEKRRK